MKINPYFEVKGKTYEIKRTRYLETEYDRITSSSKLSAEQESLFADYIKLESEYNEIIEKFKNAKDDYFANVLDKEKKEIYLAFKELSDDKYKEIKDFNVNNPEFSLNNIQKMAYENGVKLLYVALQEQHSLSEEQARLVWEDFVEHLGTQVAMEWILLMVQTLFEKDEEDENPFLKQAKAKAIQQMEHRNGLRKIKK